MGIVERPGLQIRTVSAGRTRIESISNKGRYFRAYRDAEVYQPVHLMEQGAISLSTTSPRANTLMNWLRWVNAQSTRQR